MRAFIAIQTKGVQSELSATARYIATLADGRATRRENIHITLRFLGEVQNTASIRRAIDSASDIIRPFYLSAGKLAYLRGRDMVAALPLGDTAALAMLKQVLDDYLAGCGFRLEKRRFHPHITLVRGCKKNFDIDDVGLVDRPFLVNELILFKSIFTPDGVRYVPLHTAQFKG